MARLRKRPGAGGGISYQVRWVLGGGRAVQGTIEQTETFTSKARALAFKADVEEADHQWPKNQEGVQWVKGRGYLTASTAGSTQGGSSEPPKSFHDVAESHFEDQTRMMKLGHLTPYSLHRYRRSYELHLSTTFGLMPFVDIGPVDIEDWMVDQSDLPSTAKSNRNRHGLLFSVPFRRRAGVRALRTLVARACLRGAR